MMELFRKFRLPAILLAAILIIGLFLVVGLRKTVTLSAGGSSRSITTYALRVSDLLYSQGIAISPQDSLAPSLDAWLKNGQSITLIRAVPIQILADGNLTSLFSSERKISSILKKAGIALAPGDRLLSNGQPLDSAQSLPPGRQSFSVQVIRSVSFTLQDDARSVEVASTSPSLGSALWSAGFSLYEADLLTPTVEAPPTSVVTATLVRSGPVTIHTEFGDVSFRTSATTVAQALQSAHLSPQGLDYSLPTSAEPIPAGRIIHLIRVSEQVLIEQTPIPFTNEFQAVSDLDLDSQAVVQAGEYGLNAQRVRVRYEDGQEASRQADSQWVAREPQPRIIGYGTNVVMHTTTVDGVTIQYWRAVTMYATSYHPSEVGDTTASGMPLKKGVAAVDRSIIPFYTQLYIPGYGYAVAADTGGGVHGRMIDLGYSDSDYVPWHSTVTVYFLWPPPDNIVWVIP